ncbi:hypothetical protein FOL47_003203 [Perkinsus chesapeaki]|uniref:Uncharacterized protein n=1 Tax=Perkinsus chesapeaki TaxID=330153 RepID=A0A7J6MAJ9_PERCH|nr:hypothetical protein FOL47_003203 [Perkinsus chesapeaki]
MHLSIFGHMPSTIIAVYCANVYGNFFSKLVATPDGAVSINLSGKTATVTVQTDSHTVDGATGMVNFNRKGLQYDAKMFPFIRHLWNMRYDSAKSELHLVSSVIHFEAGCSVFKRAAIKKAPMTRKLAGNSFGYAAFCSSRSQEGQGVHAEFNFYSSSLEATMELGNVRVALYGVKYNRGTADPDGNEEVRVSFPSPSEYPYLEYNFKLRYSPGADALVMSRTADGGSSSLTFSSC